MQPALNRAARDTRKYLAGLLVVAIRNVVDNALLYAGCEASGIDDDIHILHCAKLALFPDGPVEVKEMSLRVAAVVPRGVSSQRAMVAPPC